MIREVCLAALIFLSASPAESGTLPDLDRALSIEREVTRIAGDRVLWPGYDPLAIPLAIFTGERTFLFRHPSPPDGFTADAGAPPGTFVFSGRHPAITANSSADIGGTMTATLLVDGPRADRDPGDLAATALHEAFHVYQRRHHKGWSANEGDLFLYPVDDARLLALRRLESASLRRALTSSDGAAARCWTRVALGYREERFAAMDSAFAAYERLTEFNEGLATYVQRVAAGKSTVEIPETEFKATAFRDRIYTIGPALAFLLDRFNPGWPAALEGDDTQYLDRMLASAVRAEPDGAPCSIPPEEIAGIERVAKDDAAAVIASRGERRRAFDDRPGWRVIVVAADNQPLWGKGFDPFNVERVDGGILHRRFLSLSNDSGELTAIDEADADIEVLTEGVGPHPLFNGVRRVTIAGLAKPDIVSEGRKVAIHAGGLTAEFQNAVAQVSGEEVIVRLESP